MRKPPPTETWLNQTQAGRDEQHPGRQHRLEAEPGDQLEPIPAATMIVSASGR